MSETVATMSQFLSKVAPLAELESFPGTISDIDPSALYRCVPPLSRHVLEGMHCRIFRQLLMTKSGKHLAQYLDQIFEVSRDTAVVNFAVVEEALGNAVVQLFVPTSNLGEGAVRSSHPVNILCRAVQHISPTNGLALDMLLGVFPDGSFLGNAILPAATLLLLSLQYLFEERGAFAKKVCAAYNTKIVPHLQMLSDAGRESLKECARQVAGKVFRSWAGSMDLAEFFIHLVFGNDPLKNVFERSRRKTSESARKIQFMEDMKANRAYKLIYVLLFRNPAVLSKPLPPPLIVDLLAVYLLAVSRSMTPGIRGSSACYSGECLFCFPCVEQVRIQSTRVLGEAMCTTNVCLHALILKLAPGWPEFARLLMAHRMAYFGSDNTSSHLSCGCPMSTSEVALLPCKRPMVFLGNIDSTVGQYVLHQTLPLEPLRPHRASVEPDYNPFFVGGGTTKYTFFKLDTSPQFFKGRFQRLLQSETDMNPILAAMVINNSEGTSYYALNPSLKRVTEHGKVVTTKPSDECLARFLCAAIVKSKDESVLSSLTKFVTTDNMRYARFIQRVILPAHLRLSSLSVPSFTLTPKVLERAFALLNSAVPFLVERMKEKTDIKMFCERALARVVGASPRAFGYAHVYGYRPHLTIFSKLFPVQNVIAFTMMLVNNRLDLKWNTKAAEEFGDAVQHLQSLPTEMVLCILNFI